MAEIKRRGFRFRPTLIGIACFFIPLPFCVHALSGNEAVELIIAAGFPLVVVLSLLLLLVSVPFVLRSRVINFQMPALPRRMLPGRQQTVPVNPRRLRFSPGIRFSVCWFMAFGDRRYFHEVLLPSDGPAEAKFNIPHRGEWRVQVRLRETDVFGFFHLDWPYPGFQTIMIPPSHPDAQPDGIPGRPSSDSAALSRLRDDAEEKLERRPYIPGDDPRRIDWKHYARMGGLLLRTGEEGIPFRGRVWLLVVGERVPERDAQNRLDISLQAAAALARRLCRDNLNLKARLPGENQWTEVHLAENDDDERSWEIRLASALPSSAGGDICPAAGERLLVVSHPRDTAAVRLARRAAADGCRVSLVLPAWERRIPGVVHPAFSWKSLLFRLPAAAEKSRRDERRYQRILVQAELAVRSEAFDVRRI